MYKVSPEQCPNVSNQKNLNNLRYLVFRRYVEKSVTYEPWQELVLECLTQADYLVENFLDMLIEYNDIAEICIWLDRLNIGLDTVPDYVRVLIYF